MARPNTNVSKASVSRPANYYCQASTTMLHTLSRRRDTRVAPGPHPQCKET